MKERLDILIVERRLVESRTKAQWLIKNGFVLVNGVPLTKPGKKVDNNEEVILKQSFPYVGRGGLKLEAALDKFSIDVEQKTCLDLGASIGGFTDCFLQRGAKKVYAVDTAKDLLHPSLICKKNRVIQLEKTDARNLIKLGETVDIIAIDITFASLKEILPYSKHYLKEEGDIIVLVKPLFENKSQKKDKFRIITNESELKKILKNLNNWALANEIFPINMIRSPILGKGGSIEFLIHFKINKDNLTEKLEKEITFMINSLFQGNP